MDTEAQSRPIKICLTLVPKETFQKSNLQEPVGSTSDRLTFVINNICYIQINNNITTPSIINTYETNIRQKCNGLHQNYVESTKINTHKIQLGGMRRHQNAMQTSS